MSHRFYLNNPVRRYGSAILLFTAAAVIHLQFKEVIGAKIFLFMYPRVFLCALLGGFGPGLLTTCAAVGFAWYFLTPPFDSFAVQAPQDILALGSFFFTGVLLSVFSGAFHRLRKSFANARDDAMVIIDANPIPLLVINSDLSIRLANKSYCRQFRTTPNAVQNQNLFEIGNGQWKIPKLRELVTQALTDGSEFSGLEVENDLPDGVKILVVDDSVDNLRLFSVMLKSLGAIVQLAESAKDALPLLREMMPDVLLSDISMPDEDGYSFIRKVRALPAEQCGQIPAVALTAYAGLDDVQKTMAAGFSAHVAKPVEKLTLAKVIVDLLGRK